MNILLLGRTGQVGWELQRALAPLGDVTALDRSGHGKLCGDLQDPDGLAQTVRSLRPDVIVNAAAYTAVDQAEREPELALLCNARAPQALAEAAAQTGALMVHYSTDYVFDGSGDRPWREDDAPDPLNVYGRTKLEGERAVMQAGCGYLVLRTSWVYAARGQNFALTMLELGRERQRLQIVDDQWGAPTSAELVADVTAQALMQLRADPGKAGLYHLAASGHTNWAEYARHMFAQVRRIAPQAALKVAELQPISSSAWPMPAPRPHNSRLDSGRLCHTFGLRMPPWQEGVDRMLKELLE